MSLRVPLLRPLGVADIIDETFSLFRRNFVLFFCISAILVAPVSIVSSVVQGFGEAWKVPPLVAGGHCCTYCTSLWP